MSIKRYQSDVKYTGGPRGSARAVDYSQTKHFKMGKPRHYSIECNGDVHAITVMPNRAVHFHNHDDIKEMTHLITFDLMQNPEIENSTLPNCYKVLRGLRTNKASVMKGFHRENVLYYIEELLSNNLAPHKYRRAEKAKYNPVPWRDEVLNKYKASITNSLKKNLKYYGMNNEGYYDFNMKFDFCLSPHFTPSAVMSLSKERYHGSSLILAITVSPKWLINVWLKNRAIVEQNLILSIVKEYPNGTTLCLAAKQSHGFKINPKLAVVDFSREVISWVNDADRKHEYLEENKMPRMRRRKKEITGEAATTVENPVEENKNENV